MQFIKQKGNACTDLKPPKTLPLHFKSRNCNHSLVLPLKKRGKSYPQFQSFFLRRVCAFICRRGERPALHLHPQPNSLSSGYHSGCDITFVSRSTTFWYGSARIIPLCTARIIWSRRASPWQPRARATNWGAPFAVQNSAFCCAEIERVRLMCRVLGALFVNLNGKWDFAHTHPQEANSALGSSFPFALCFLTFCYWHRTWLKFGVTRSRIKRRK